LGWFNDRDEQLRDKIASHLQQDVLPRVRAWTAQRYIQLGDVFSGFGQRRWLGRRLPARLGGLDATVWQHVVLTECLGELLCEGFAEAVIAHNDIALPLLAEQAHPKIVDQYLRPALQGRVILTHVVLPAVSSTLAPPSAVAVPVPSGYRVNGTLPAVVAAQQADVFVVLAHILDKGSPRGDVVLLIPATERGVSLEPIAPIQRTLSNGTATANLTEVFVPGEALVATQEAVPAMLRQMQDQQRVMSAARMVALADRVLRLTIEYLGTRRAFGIEMRRHQAIQFRLADLAAQLDGVRQLTYTTVNFWASGEEYSRLAAAAELRAIRIARLVCHQCLHLHGAAGQIEDHPVGHAFLDVHITSVTAEPDQVLLSKIADFPEWTHG
jgi:citronellyl-CoA dehydrogenase